MAESPVHVPLRRRARCAGKDRGPDFAQCRGDVRLRHLVPASIELVIRLRHSRDYANAMNDVAEAVRLLRAGKLVAFPTETVYGLGADATSAAAVRGIFAAKGRPPT